MALASAPDRPGMSIVPDTALSSRRADGGGCSTDGRGRRQLQRWPGGARGVPSTPSTAAQAPSAQQPRPAAAFRAMAAMAPRIPFPACPRRRRAGAHPAAQPAASPDPATGTATTSRPSTQRRARCGAAAALPTRTTAAARTTPTRMQTTSPVRRGCRLCGPHRGCPAALTSNVELHRGRRPL